MRRSVVWSRDALDDLKEQVAFIAADNPSAAIRVSEQLRGAAARLAEMPIGRPGRVSGTFERTVVRLPYIIAYSLTRIGEGRETITILRVIHSARNWHPGTWPE